MSRPTRTAAAAARTTVSMMLLSLWLTAAHAKPPYIDPAEDARHFGEPEATLFWTPEQRIAGFRNIDRLRPTRVIEASDDPLPLPARTHDFSALRYSVDGEQYRYADFIDAHNIVGLIVVQDGHVLDERYTSGNTANSRWVSFSIAKSVTSMLIGAAIQDGYIASVEEPVTDYLPRLQGTSYEGVRIRDVLQMASGVAWDETYDDPASDVNTTPADYLGLVATLARKERVAKPGTTFNYNTGETNLAGAILRAAIGNNLSTYLSAKIWRPFGMQSDATWMLDAPDGGEWGGCCINATLRDYARLGLFALNDGRLADGTTVLPANWMTASTAPSSGAPFYGYLWWLFDEGTYAAIGIYGQTIYIDPARKLVIATHSSYETAVGEHYSAHRSAFLKAVGEALDER